MNFSAEQQSIFNWFQSGKGNLVVRARAGTGKTTTIKEAFSYAPEKKICYAVFNRKNQVEAAHKITDPRVEVKTLHSLGYSYIKRIWPGVRPDDNIEFDRLDSLFNLNNLPEERGMILKLVSFAKNCAINPSAEDLEDICEERDIDYSESDVDIIGCAMEVLNLSKERDSQNRISFNDMVWLPVACNWVKPWFDLVVIDEAQDQSLPQLTMSRLASRGRVVVVGDNRQCIYSFRGANHNGMDEMKRILNASELTLSTTYRCAKSVVKQAQSIVPDYKFADDSPDGMVSSVPIRMMESIIKVGDAVLSRLNAPLMPIALGLLRRNIPARIEGRDIGKQLITMVKSMKAKSVPNFLEKVQSWLDKQIQRLTIQKNNEKKIEQCRDMADTLSAIAQECKSVADIESRITNLFADTETESNPAVVLSSVHKAKGLEWPRVFLLSETFRKGNGIEEDNIWYVAVTRAMKSLYFVGGKAETPVSQSESVMPATNIPLISFTQGDVIRSGADEYGCLYCTHNRSAFRKLNGDELMVLKPTTLPDSVNRKLTGEELDNFLLKGDFKKQTV